jgi:hypothetical protein
MAGIQRPKVKDVTLHARRRALELLAASRDGCTEALVNTEVARVRITEAGRRAVAE